MLKFNSWPPTKGEIEFTAEFRDAYTPAGAPKLGFLIGSLIANNLPEDRKHEVAEIIHQLVHTPGTPDDIYDYNLDAEDGFDVHPFEEAAYRGAGTSAYDAAKARSASTVE